MTSISSLLNPLKPAGSHARHSVCISDLSNPPTPPVIGGGDLSEWDIPDLGTDGLGPPAIKLIESKNCLNHFPSHNEGLKLLVPALLDLSGQEIRPMLPGVCNLIMGSSPSPTTWNGQLPLVIPAQFSVPARPTPTTTMSFLSEHKPQGFKGIVTKGPSPYWKFPPSGPYYPPPGPFQTSLLTLLEDSVVFDSPPVSELQQYDRSYVSMKMQQKRQRTASPDIHTSRKRQRTEERSPSEHYRIVDESLGNSPPTSFHDHYVPSDRHQVSEEALSPTHRQPDASLWGLSPVGYQKTGGDKYYGIWPEYSKDEIWRFTDNRLPGYSMTRRRKSSDSGYDTGSLDSLRSSASRPSISQIFGPRDQIYSTPPSYIERWDLAACKAIDLTKASPITLSDPSSGLSNP